MLVYVAFALYLFLILCMGIGVYKLWTKLVRPAWIDWALLPGTVVSEMSYIFGWLITGGEIQRAKLLSDDSKGSSSSSKTQAKPGLKTIGAILASLVGILGCAASLVAVQAVLGKKVIARFAGAWAEPGLPMELPASWSGFWGQAARLLDLQRATCETFAALEWGQWQVALFVYLSICLAIRLAPSRSTGRGTVGAIVLLAALCALVGALSTGFRDVLLKAWPLLTYVWAGLLTALMATLLLHGGVSVVRAIGGKGEGGGGSSSSKSGGRSKGKSSAG